MIIKECKNTNISNLGSIHGLQFLKVDVSHKGQIPLHKHNCSATMIVTKGSAYKILGNGKNIPTKIGEVIHKKPNQYHGFTKIGKNGFQFISISDGDGIVRKNKIDIDFN